MFFTIPWYGRSLVGTTDDDYSGDPDQVSVGRKDVNSILEAVNRFFPGCGWGEGSVLGSFVGLRALKQEWGKAASAVSREWVLEEPLERFLVSVGGKYTTARAEAERIVDRVEVMLNRRASRTKPTRSRPLPWCPQEPFDAWLGRVRQEATQLGLAPDMAESLALRYGASVPGVFERIRQCRSLGRRLVPGLPFCRAEVAHAAAAEMAVSLADVLRRRLPVMILSPLQPEVLRDAAELTAQTLGWEEGRKARELRAAEDAWSPGWS